jgi:hypothetical protein
LITESHRIKISSKSAWVRKKTGGVRKEPDIGTSGFFLGEKIHENAKKGGL